MEEFRGWGTNLDTFSVKYGAGTEWSELGLHDMWKICDNIVECRDNDITCDK